MSGNTPLYLVMAAAGLIAAFGAGLFPTRVAAGDLNKPIPAPVLDMANDADTEVAVLAGGCFWGQQGVFQHVKGVSRVVSGYSGGAKETATYEQVARETTGHAEAVEITFDPKQVSFGTLLRIYFSVAHDPTQLDRQGPDHGPSYRSQVFAVTPRQAEIARAYIAQLDAAGLFTGPIVTRVEPLAAFYAAEDYHQDYMARNPGDSYIRVHDAPKVAALARVWPDHYRPDPVLLAHR
ncbi:MAG: peptide-methionine (S)-S-oxide reductase [Alphaproteobacteria bacterium 65-7]|mgnify:CR=1 FL=1|nr:MAG: peptide-methionine (S)-S-oxide reductase [Alphaproteobacteria bacterium 65-7]